MQLLLNRLQQDSIVDSGEGEFILFKVSLVASHFKDNLT